MKFLLDRLITAALGLLFGALVGLVASLFIESAWQTVQVRDLVTWEGPVKFGALLFGALGLLFGASAGTAIAHSLDLLWRLFTLQDLNVLPPWARPILLLLVLGVVAWAFLD